MKCGSPITKGHLNVFPAKEIKRKNFNYKGNFATLCKSRNKRPTVNTVNDNYVNTENCTYVSPESSWGDNQESCDVINSWKKHGHSDDDDFSVLSVRTIYDKKRAGNQETAKHRLGMGNDRNMNIPVDSASPVSFLKQNVNVLHELKLIPQPENPPSGEGD